MAINDSTGTAKILIVEDDHFLSDSLAEVLIEHKFTVRQVRDGHSALVEIRSFHPEVVILDVMLASKEGVDWMDGRDVLKTMAKERLNARVIVISEIYKDMKSILEFIDLGAADYIAKPVHPANILERVNAVLAVEGATNLQVIHRSPLINSYLQRSKEILDKSHDKYSRNMVLQFLTKVTLLAFAVIVVVILARYSTLTQPFLLFLVFFIILVPAEKITRFVLSTLGSKAVFDFKETSLTPDNPGATTKRRVSKRRK